MANAPSKSDNSGCLMLFALPFFVIGLLFAIKSMQALETNDPTFKNPQIGVVMGSAFALIGVLIFAAGMQGRRAAANRRAKEAQYPGEPWMWNADWAQGRAPGQTSRSALFLWIATVFWNSVTWIAISQFWQHPPRNTPKLFCVWFALFPLVGAGLLIAAVGQALRLARYGRTVLQLETIPAALGLKLKGTIDVRLPYPPPHGINQVFSCVNRVTTGSGKNRSTADYIRWQATKSLGPEQVMAGPLGATIPVEFDVPRDMSPTDHSNPNSQILWLVRAEADVPGVDFDEKYEVPVYATSASPNFEQWSEKERAEEQRHPPTAPLRPTVLVSPAPEGGTQFYFPAGRGVRSALIVTLVTLVLGTLEYWLITSNAPVIFAVIFGFITVLMLIISLNLWFGSARIVADGNGVGLQTKVLGMGGTKHWASSEIRDIYPKITVHSEGVKGAYYNLMLNTTQGEYSIGKMIHDHNEAEWICAQIKQIANIQ